MSKQSVRSKIVMKRTYCRPKEDGIQEDWEDVIERVICHQRWLWSRALTQYKEFPGIELRDLTSDMNEWYQLTEEQENELERLRYYLLQRKTFMSGRTMWLGNTDISRTRESSMFNCAATDVGTVVQIVNAFHLLLQGAGVGFYPKTGLLTGFRSPINNIEVIQSKRSGMEKGRETTEESFDNGVWCIQLGDSAEAWAKVVGKILANKYKADKLILDFSQIRGAGFRLSGYGWLSSGDISISKALVSICAIMNKRAGSLLRKIDILEIMNHLGTVLSSRRSATIALFDYGEAEWKEFAKFKNDCYQEGKTHRQQSNNSLIFHVKPTKEQLEEVFQMMVDSGGSEPGIINAQTMENRAPYASLVNPCGEILLPSSGVCNLAEIDLGKFKGDTAGLYDAAVLIARANYRMTCVSFDDGILSEEWQLNNDFLHLMGVSVSGVVKRDDMTQYDYKNLRDTLSWAGRNMAKELGTPYPKQITTIKPSGTIGKVADTTEGCHRPIGKYVMNNINFSKHDPIVDKLLEAGYAAIDNPSDETSIIVSIPVIFDDVKFDTVEVIRKDGTKETLEVNNESALDQLARYKMLMTYYCDQNVSITVYYDKEEVKDIIDWILANWGSYVGISFLPRLDATMSAADVGYPYLPQEVITKETYDTYMSQIQEIDWEGTDTESTELLADETCSTGACPIR